MGPEDKVEGKEDEKEELIIPGLDIDEAEKSTKQEKQAPKKTPYQKPIPKKFQAIWNDSKVEEELEDDRGMHMIHPGMSILTRTWGMPIRSGEGFDRDNFGGRSGFDRNGGGGDRGFFRVKEIVYINGL